MKRIRIAAWAAVAVLVAGLGAALLLQPAVGGLLARLWGGSSGSMPLAAQIGGPFELTTHEGRRMSNAELKGKPFAVFFGFSYCPDVCPTTLQELSNVLERLGPDADRMHYLFVSVDPERDTPEHLKLYLSSFDNHITGLTGTPQEIAAIAKAYRAVYEKVPTKDGGFTFNHTAVVYLMDRDGHFAGTMNFQESEDVQLKKLRRLIGVSS
ncbi:MAG TPA: SCO family protein [Hyphomicrobiaceae bacterium]|nr:SCO family protein [Hyphomicrobiaceae bacterium]